MLKEKKSRQAGWWMEKENEGDFEGIELEFR